MLRAPVAGSVHMNVTMLAWWNMYASQRYWNNSDTAYIASSFRMAGNVYTTRTKQQPAACHEWLEQPRSTPILHIVRTLLPP